MEQQLLIRAYKVGCGDCIFIRVPDKDRPFHILIDCGNFFGNSSAELKKAMKNVEELLNDEVVPEDRRGHLDLIVATHRHWDHIKGFESALKVFKKIKVEHIWLPIAMKEDHPEGLQLRALQNQVEEVIKRIESDPDFSLSPGLFSLMQMMSLSTKEASKALTSLIPSHHGIKPIFVYRGFEKDFSTQEKEKALLKFKDSKTKLHVLAPEKNIDKSYVEGAWGFSETLEKGKQLVKKFVPVKQRIKTPTNISSLEFQQLKTHLKYASLLAAVTSNHVINNTSVVLLLEWKGNRLVFAGDAEHESWSLIWKKAKSKIKKPIDFLKVSHHGSINGTPFDIKNSNNPINVILNAILPEANANSAKAIVTTMEDVIQAELNPVPHLDLMKELSKRVSNTNEYLPQPGKQPQRTDKEDEPWIDIMIGPKK